jgi:hypothetical protein
MHVYGGRTASDTRVGQRGLRNATGDYVIGDRVVEAQELLASTLVAGVCIQGSLTDNNRAPRSYPSIVYISRTVGVGLG